MSGLDSIVDAEIVLSSAEWAERIRGHLGKAVEGIVAAGRDLIAAKADVRHGEWLPMLKEIGISEPESRRLQAIGREFSNRPNLDDLPRSVTALYELSRVPADEIESGIASGDITPDMTIKDARNFARPEPEPTPEPEPAPRPQSPDGMPPGFNPGDLDELNTPAPDRPSRAIDDVPIPQRKNRTRITDQVSRAVTDMNIAAQRLTELLSDQRAQKHIERLAKENTFRLRALQETITDAIKNLEGENQ